METWLTRGFGTAAASQEIKSNGSNPKVILGLGRRNGLPDIIEDGPDLRGRRDTGSSICVHDGEPDKTITYMTSH